MITPSSYPISAWLTVPSSPVKRNRSRNPNARESHSRAAGTSSYSRYGVIRGKALGGFSDICSSLPNSWRVRCQRRVTTQRLSWKDVTSGSGGSACQATAVRQTAGDQLGRGAAGELAEIAVEVGLIVVAAL